MSFSLVTPRREIDLGPTLEFFRFLKEMGGKIDAAKTDADYPHLLTLIETSGEPQADEWVAAVKAEAATALKAFRWSDHAAWILQELAGA